MVNPKEATLVYVQLFAHNLGCLLGWEANITTRTLISWLYRSCKSIPLPDKVGSIMMTIIYVSSLQWDGFIVIWVDSKIIIVVKTKTFPYKIHMKEALHPSMSLGFPVFQGSFGYCFKIDCQDGCWMFKHSPKSFSPNKKVSYVWASSVLRGFDVIFWGEIPMK